MKTAVIAPVGMSPPVITEFIDGIGEPVSDLVLLATNHPKVMAGVNLVRAALARRYQWLRIHSEILPYEDIATGDQNYDFMKHAVRVFSEEREKHHCDKIYLNVAGGRKNMCITLSLVGQLLAADGVFHLVNRNVDVVNQRLEQSRRIISEFETLQELEAAIAVYEEHAHILDDILFPDRRSYDIIRIPTLPYPSDYLAYLVTGMKDRGAGLAVDDQDLLIRHGLIDKTGTLCDLTPHGESFLDVIFQR